MAKQRVVAAVVTREGRYLICQRPAHKRHGGLWEFPGGKVEPGESDADALRRELREELGVAISSVGPELFHRADNNSPFLIAFIAVTITGDPLCHEHTALAWSTPPEMAAVALAPTDAAFAAHLRSEAGDGP